MPILSVSRPLGHRDPSITLHVYAQGMPAASDVRAVDLLDVRDRMQHARAQHDIDRAEWKTRRITRG